MDLLGPITFDRFTQEARAAVVWAQETARWQGADKIDLPHLLYAACQQPIGFCLLKRAGADPQRLAGSLEGVEAESKQPGHLVMTRRTRAAIQRAWKQAGSWSHPCVTSGHLVVGIVATRSGRSNYGGSIGVDAKSLKSIGESVSFLATDSETSDLFAELLGLEWLDDDGRAWLEHEQVTFSIQNEQDLRASVALLMATADGKGLSRFPDLGVILGELTGDTSLILQSYEKAQSVKPAFADSFRMSGALALAERGRFEEARAIVGSLLQREPLPGFYVNAAEVELLADQVDDARAYLIKAISAIGEASHIMRELAEILMHSIDGGFEDALRTIVDAQVEGPFSRFTQGLARIAQARDACLAGDDAASNQLYEITDEYEQSGMEAVALEALVVLAESQQRSGDERFEETARRTVELARRLGRSVRVRRLKRI